ncbi:hypothetical protein N7468_007689 [Penicillium chermesinum]|uniref:Uncharacterized protein n=1 Tax=Penicillium chermesinum TaxID=63820 RepID=A0A9W9NXG3_9EURO|nr:uncharacterized protein N7468_007689 [Penicillium chermesinum]KAJ5226464.1 hypothetical protein N7468_007689 [Penicillium chermesinum]
MSVRPASRTWETDMVCKDCREDPSFALGKRVSPVSEIFEIPCLGKILGSCSDATVIVLRATPPRVELMGALGVMHWNVILKGRWLSRSALTTSHPAFGAVQEKYVA